MKDYIKAKQRIRFYWLSPWMRSLLENILYGIVIGLIGHEFVIQILKEISK